MKFLMIPSAFAMLTVAPLAGGRGLKFPFLVLCMILPALAGGVD